MSPATAMKFLSSLAILSLSLLSVSMPAIAQHQTMRSRDLAKEPTIGELQRPFLRRNEPKGVDGTAERPALREASSMQPAEALKQISEQRLLPRPGSERLSPEERRQLRRDINAAGRDIYRRQK